MKIVSICEKRPQVLSRLGAQHGVPAPALFTDWRDFLSAPDAPSFDAVFICLQDRQHFDCAMAFFALDCDMLLEKPIGVSLPECARLLGAHSASCARARAAGRRLPLFAACHVLRYAPHNLALVAELQSGGIGQLQSVQHIEPVGWFHAAHSYVRGAWRREDAASGMLLAKCCHDVDLLLALVRRRCLRVSSFGNRRHFRAENAPKGAGKRCVECPKDIEDACAFSARKIYAPGNPWLRVVCEDGVVNEENRGRALREGPYGRCVYHCDNDVVDHQVVSFEFEGGVLATLHMEAMSADICVRRSHFFGSKGEMKLEHGRIQKFDFTAGQFADWQAVPVDQALSAEDVGRLLANHGSADYYLMQTFVTAFEQNDPPLLESSMGETIRSHALVFAAEKARVEGTVVHFDEFLKENGLQDLF